MFSKNAQESYFMKYRPVGAGLFHADTWTVRHDEVNICFSQFLQTRPKILPFASGGYRHILYVSQKDSLVCSLLIFIPCADKLCASLDRISCRKLLPVHNIKQRAERHPSSDTMNTTEFPGSGKSLLVCEK